MYCRGCRHHTIAVSQGESSTQLPDTLHHSLKRVCNAIECTIPVYGMTNWYVQIFVPLELIVMPEPQLS